MANALQVPMVRRLPLLTELPELGLGVPEGERALAERTVLVPQVDVSPGAVNLADHVVEPALGVIVVDGFLSAVTELGGQLTEQILGPGDIVQTVRPDAFATLPVTRRHRALTEARLAVMDRRFIAAVRRWPGLLLGLHDQLRVQQRELSLQVSIGHLRRGEDRLLAILWQLAERWGRVSMDGVVVPLRLRHNELGRMAGASRPTTSLAMAALEERGSIRRGDDGRLVLEPESWQQLAGAGHAPPCDRPRRRATPAPVHLTAEASGQVPRVTAIDTEALMRRVSVMHEAFDDQQRSVDELLAAARATIAKNVETRARLREARAL